jgi:hypothetical protein
MVQTVQSVRTASIGTTEYSDSSIVAQALLNVAPYTDVVVSPSSKFTSDIARETLVAPLIARLVEISNDGSHSTAIGRGKKVLSRSEKRKKLRPLVGGKLPIADSKAIDVNKLRDSLTVLLQYLSLYGFDPTGFKTGKTLDHWQLCSESIGWIKFLKYKFSAFFAAYLHTDLPKQPFAVKDNPLHIIGGRAGRFVTKVLGSSHGMSFALGLLYLKKGLPRPDESALELAKQATLEMLTRLHPVPNSSILNPSTTHSFDGTRNFNLGDLKDEVRRTVFEIYRGMKLTDEDLYKPYVPSINANYTTARSKFGTFGVLRDRGLIDDLPDRFYGRDIVSTLYGSGCIEKISDMEEYIEDETVEHYRINKDFKSMLATRYREVFDQVRLLAVDEITNVELVALAEALKVRTISKGPPFKYFTLKPIQKFIHKILRRHPTFQLVGKNVSESIIQRVIQDKFTTFGGDFLSVDYASATDLINPELSRACVDALSECLELPADLRKMFHEALTGHIVEGRPQLWGQLMGSIVSFPILCIVNAAICRLSFEVGEELPYGVVLSDCPILINGDDGLLRCSVRTKEVWEDLSSLGGLSPSVGKVYFHKTYLNINSTSYSCIDGRIVHHPYVNMGLVQGMTRSEGKASVKNITENQSTFGTLGSRHRDLMRSCPDDIRLLVHKLFVKCNYETLKAVRLPWFVPESLGGVGLEPFLVSNSEWDIDLWSESYLEVDGVRYGPSDRDIYYSNLLQNGELSQFSVKKVTEPQPIQARQVWFKASDFSVRRQFVVGKLSSTLASCVESQQKAFSFLDLSTFYLCPSFVTPKLDTSYEVLRSNERVWSILSGLDHLIPSQKGQILRVPKVVKTAMFEIQ